MTRAHWYALLCSDVTTGLIHDLSQMMLLNHPEAPWCSQLAFHRAGPHSTNYSECGRSVIRCYSPGIGKFEQIDMPNSDVCGGYTELFFDAAKSPFLDPFALDSEDDDALDLYDIDQSPRYCDRDTIDMIRRLLQKSSEEWLGQHSLLLQDIFSRQHRTCLFTVAVFGTRARFFRWDTTRVVFTRAIMLHEDDGERLLLQFLSEFSRASYTSRGHDCSVGRVTAKEEELFRDAITREVQIQNELAGDSPHLEAAVSRHYFPGRVAAVTILPEGAENIDANLRRVLVSRPLFSFYAMFRRAYAYYWAVDVRTNTVVLMKDTWRQVVDARLEDCDDAQEEPEEEEDFWQSSQGEGEIIAKLNSLGVRNVPLLRYHGTVATPGFTSKSFVSCCACVRCAENLYQRVTAEHICPRVHSRIALGFIR